MSEARKPALSPIDLKRIKSIVDDGHKLEKTWPRDPDGIFATLKSHVSCLSESEALEVSRLSFHAGNLTLEMTSRHLSTILVPFERLLGRALRDDEFLVTDTDRVATEVDRVPVLIIADNIRSSFNVGAIFRTAECFAAEEVLLAGYTATPDDLKTSKTSLGTEEEVRWKSIKDGTTAIRESKLAGYEVVALETAERAIDLQDFIWPEKCAILLGNERFGIEPSLLEEADHVVRIPMYGKKNSLNVGIALGIALNDRRQSKTSSRIGTFSSTAIHPYDVSRQASVTESGEIACIELAKGFDFEQAVKDLEGFDRIWLVYRFHQNKSWKPMVVPPRGPRTKRGVFATRSPYRPNSIGISCVELVKADGLKIFVRSHDLLDGTPILDVKPYLPYADSFPDAKIGWLSGLEELAHKIDFSEDAKADLAWLEARGVQQIETFIRSQLTFDPLDDSRKRVRPLDPQNFPNRFELAYRTWRIQFDHSEDRSAVYVLKMTSGYSTEDLASRDDKYLDKEVHRAFIAR